MGAKANAEPLRGKERSGISPGPCSLCRPISLLAVPASPHVIDKPTDSKVAEDPFELLFVDLQELPAFQVLLYDLLVDVSGGQRELRTAPRELPELLRAEESLQVLVEHVCLGRIDYFEEPETPGVVEERPVLHLCVQVDEAPGRDMPE